MTFAKIFIFFIYFCYNVSYTAAWGDKKIFCMYNKRTDERTNDAAFKVENIDAQSCTHLIYTFMGIKDDGQLNSLNPSIDFEEYFGLGNIKRFNRRKHYNVNLKTLAAVGGLEFTETARRYSAIFKNEQNQENFVKSVVTFLLKYNFDGLAMYWAYPGMYGGDQITDKVAFTSLLKKLRQELSKNDLMLVAICHGYRATIDTSYNVRDVSMLVDYIILITYDLYGTWSEHIGIASGLYEHPLEQVKGLSVDSIINNWIVRGAPSEKLIMSIPFFSKTFTLKYQNQTEPGADHIGPGIKTERIQYSGYMSYMELCRILNDESWTFKWETTQKNPYAFKDDQWVGFENARSLEIKSKYIIDKKMGGVAVVYIEDDDFRGFCGEKYPLLKILNRLLRESNDSQYEFIFNVSVFKKSLKDQYTQCVYHTTIKN